jgi:L-alanine-DL-glutamate epimerase-like enolase superfamily enzyme
VGRVLDDLDFFWFENPISDLDMKGLSSLASKLGVPLAVGEQNFAGFPAIHEYLASGTGFYVRTLAEYSGGITQNDQHRDRFVPIPRRTEHPVAC